MYSALKIIIVFTSCVFLSLDTFAQCVEISEVMASNNSSISDEEGEFEDWIELYNPTESSISLGGYYISDKLDDPKKFQFEQNTSLSIPAKGYLIVWASEKNELGDHHLNFKLSSGGEAVVVSNPNGDLCDSLTFYNQKTDVSFGRINDESRYFSPASPNSQNLADNSYLGFLEPPVFSHQSGFYKDNFQLNLSHKDENSEIVYSFDGSIPNPTAIEPQTYEVKYSYPRYPNSTTGGTGIRFYRSYKLLQSESIPIVNPEGLSNYFSEITTTFDNHCVSAPSSPIDKAKVINAIAFREGFLPSEMVSKTYLFSQEGNNPYQMPVISLSVQPNFLFDYWNGIYVAGVDFDNWRNSNPNSIADDYTVGNYKRRGRENEKFASVSYFPENTVTIEQNVGLRISGATSRTYPKKSLRIYARSEYGKNTFDFPVFDDLEYDIFKRLTLYSSSQDLYGTLIKDITFHRAAANLNFETQAGKLATVFLNGEFWGSHFIRERSDKYYFESKYGVDPENLDITKTVYPTSENMEEGDPKHYSALSSYFHEHEISNTSEYEYIKTQMDVDNFIDYNITEIFYGNADWGYGNNVGFWREKVVFDSSLPKGKDGRWRWFLFDIDGGMVYKWIDTNYLETGTNSSVGEPTLFLRKLLNNSEFKSKFINRFCDLLNSTFLPNNTRYFIDKNYADIEKGIEKHIHRWGVPGKFEDEINNLRKYADEKPDIQKSQLKSFFFLNDLSEITIDISDSEMGVIKVNTLYLNSGLPGFEELSFPWKGEYFNEFPIELSTISQPGYEFLYWETADSKIYEKDISMLPSELKYIKAVFGVSDILGGEDLSSSVNVYPNPTNSLITIDLSSLESPVILTLLDQSGKSLQTIKGITEKTKILDLSNYISGTYILNIKNKEGSNSIRVVKK